MLSSEPGPNPNIIYATRPRQTSINRVNIITEEHPTGASLGTAATAERQVILSTSGARYVLASGITWSREDKVRYTDRQAHEEDYVKTQDLQTQHKQKMITITAKTITHLNVVNKDFT